MTKPTRTERSYRAQVARTHASLLDEWLDFLNYHERGYLDSNATRQLEITLLPLEWRANESIDLEPRFSQPFSLAKIDKLYARTRASNYHQEYSRYWGRWDEERRKEEYEYLPKNEVDGNIAALYVTGHIGHYDLPYHIAAQTDWLMCSWGDAYKELSREPSFRHRETLHNVCFFRALPWPQAELPDNPKKLERLRARLGAMSRSDWTTTIDEATRRPGQKSLVHFAAVIVDTHEPCEERLLRNEMAVALRAMRDQLQQRKNWLAHVIFPVFVYAFAGKHVRVLQVHLDPVSRTLIVRKTSYIHISGPEKIEEIKLLLSWMMATPTGRTSYDEVALKLEDIAGSELKEEPYSPKKRAMGISQG